MKRLIALLWGGFVLTSIVGMIAAVAAKRRTVGAEDPDANEIRIAAMFEPLLFRSKAPRFRGGMVDCWYGGGAIDLRDAVMDPAGARLRVRALFGGAQIVVPETWRVTSKVRGIGGVGDARSKVERPAAAPHLAIEGVAIFGGFALTSELSESEIRGLEEAIARRAERPHLFPSRRSLIDAAV